MAEDPAAAARLLDLRLAPTALLCLSDRLAEGALAEAARRALAVPGDVSAAG